tara:strand:- start:1061 stop:2368 length:1308 start_codon:yes stop_codon:yes gene_type:complete
MANTELSEFFSLVSQEKNQNKTRLKKQIENPQSDLANLFKELETALLETKKEPVVSVEIEDEPESEPESIIEETSDEQTRLDEFSKLVTSFNSSTPSPAKKVEIIDTVDTVNEEDKLESFSNLMDSLNKTKEEPEEVEAIIENEDEIKEASEVDYIKDTVTQIAATKPKNPRQVDVYEKPITDFESLQKEFINFKHKVVEQLSSLGGGGAVRINDMDDLDTSGREDGDSLIYNASTNKFTFSSASSTPNLSNQLSLEDSIDGNLLMNGTDSSSTDAGDDFLQESGVNGGRDLDHNILQKLTSDIIPQASATYDLGSENYRFRNLYLESDTVDIGGATISSDGSGVITISADGVTLPTGSKDADGFILARTISEASGATFKIVKLFTQASGLTTAATEFKFNARKSNTAVYTDAGHVFTLSNGSARSDSAVDLFQF